MNYHEKVSKTLIKNLEKRQMEAYYVETKEDAVRKVLSLMPQSSSVGWAGSETLIDCGMIDALRESNYVLFDRSLAKNEEEQRRIYADMFMSDYFLMSSSAITEDGELVNVDGRGNRLACMCYGPRNVIVLVSLKKLVKDVDAGIKRIKSISAPQNAVKLNKNTPCNITATCSDCLSPDTICSQTLVTRYSSTPQRIKVILIRDDYGF